MRIASLTSLVWLVLSSPVFAASAAEEKLPEGAMPAVQVPENFDGTTFNGQLVPRMKDLSGQNIDKDIAKGYWMVEFYSPYCGHCKSFAPTLQTAYEFYYTSNPLSEDQKTEDNLNSFTRYYDFHFAKLDCIAFGTACSNAGVHSFPTLIIYHNGEKIKESVGAKSMKELGNWIEETLETIRPGSRPKNGPKLPKAGAKYVPADTKSKTTESKDKDPGAGAAAGKKQNALASSVAAAEPSSLTVAKKGQPNPEGKSVHLTASQFQKQVTLTQEPWFIKFYAPWCPHCQTMQPHWIEMAREMKGKLNVGEVNCDVEKRLCKDAKVRGYPTLLFFKGGERVEYEGLRGVGDLISYAKKTVDTTSGVQEVDLAAFEEMEKTEEVIFVYVYDHATTTEDFAALERLTMSMIGHGKLVKSKDPKIAERFKVHTWPRLLVSRDAKPSYYDPLAPSAMRDFRKVLNWMKSVWLPIVPELTASNAREIMDGKIVVLAILSRDRSDEFITSKRELKNAALEWIDKQVHAFQLERQELRDAKQLRIEEAEDRNDQRALRAAKSIRIDMDELDRKQIGFAWVDGVFWERWVKTTFGINVKEDGERVVINDEENRRYWDTTVTGNPIVPSRTSILETLPRVIANPPKITPKSSASSIERFFLRVRNIFTSHPWLWVVGITVSLVAAIIFSKRRRSRQGGYFQLDGEKGSLLGGFGGSGPNGKVD